MSLTLREISSLSYNGPAYNRAKDQAVHRIWRRVSPEQHLKSTAESGVVHLGHLIVPRLTQTVLLFAVRRLDHGVQGTVRVEGMRTKFDESFADALSIPTRNIITGAVGAVASLMRHDLRLEPDFARLPIEAEVVFGRNVPNESVSQQWHVDSEDFPESPHFNTTLVGRPIQVSARPSSAAYFDFQTTGEGVYSLPEALNPTHIAQRSVVRLESAAVYREASRDNRPHFAIDARFVN